MQCPNCQNEILQPGPTCPRCGATLGAAASPALVATPQATTALPATRPLTGMNRARLIIDSVPVIFWVAMLIFVAFFLDDIIGPGQSLLLLSLFVGLIVLVTGYQAMLRIRDLLSGAAVVEEDVMERSWQSRRGPGRFGVFTKLGRMSMTSQAFRQGQNGGRYRVAYSPASKIVWSLEKVA